MSHWIVNLLVPVPVRYILYLKPFVSISTFFLHVWRSWIRIQNGSGSTSLQGMPRYKWILGARHYVTWPPKSCQGKNSSLISSYNLRKLIVANFQTSFRHPSTIWISIVLLPSVLRSRHFFGRLRLQAKKGGSRRLQAAPAPYTKIFNFELWKSELIRQVYFGPFLPF